MKQITLQIPDDKYRFIKELLDNFDYLKMDDIGTFVSENHKNEVRNRIRESDKDPSRLLDWDSAKKQLKF